MAKTFLDGVNNVMKRLQLIQGDASKLTSFTSSARQRDIDTIVQIWNEVVHELYIRNSLTGEQKTGTITLVADTREYSLPSDFLQMAGEEFRDRVMTEPTNQRQIWEYPGGYEKMFAFQPDPAQYTGSPNSWAINGVTQKFRLDRTPTSDEAGLVYSFLYDKELVLENPSDTYPFNDTIFAALVPVVVMVYRLDRDGKARDPISAVAGFKRAVGMLNQNKSMKTYGVSYA